MPKTKPLDLSKERWAVGNRKKDRESGCEYRVLRDEKGKWLGDIRDDSPEDSARIAPALLYVAVIIRQLLENMHGQWPGTMSIDAEAANVLVDAAIGKSTRASHVRY